MPSKTPKQNRFMAACATMEGRKKSKGKCPSKKVAEEFVEAGLKSPMKEFRGKPKGMKRPAGRKR